MKKILIMLLTLIAVGILALPGYAAMSVDWKVDTTTSDIVTRDNMRDIAYNPVTGHILLAEGLGAEDSTQRGVWILDSNSGETIGRLLDPDTGWSGGSGSQISPYGICVDANGVIYVQRYFYTSNNEILRYADETSTPTVAGTNDNTYVRSLNVTGTGIDTKLVTVCQNDMVVRIFGTTDGVSFSEFERFDASGASGAVHDALPASAAVDTVYTARAFAGTSAASTLRWIKSGVWSQDASWTSAAWIMTLALSEPTNTLYGVIWDMANSVPAVTEGIRAWNATTGVQTGSLDIGESGASSRGCYLSNIAEFSVVDVAQSAETITVGGTKQLNVTANLARKIFFVICGGIGYGRVDLGAVVTGPVWSSNNYSVASVDGTGLVNAIAPGSCTISATYTKDGVPYADSAAISVIATSAPLARDASSVTKIHRVEPVGEISVPRAIRSWELFQ
jgi:hypothetical protein